jgi:adenylate cyclase
LSFFGIAPEDKLAVRKKKIRAKVKSLDEKLINWPPVIGEVLGAPFSETKLTKFLDAKIRKQKFFDIVFDIVKHMAKRGPLCLVIEDMHWIDSVSMELVNYIARNIQSKKIFILLVFRPVGVKEEFMEKDYYSTITVKELNQKEAAQLAGNLLNIRALPDDFKKTVIMQSQGNPFYIEEIVKSFIEQGIVQEDRKGKWKFAGDIKHIRLPDTVEGIILTRIDRLDIAEKDVLQTASVLGRAFDEFLITAIYPDKKLLRRALGSLRKLDLIRGVFIEEELKDRREEFLGLLSHHFYHGKDYNKSLLYSVEAGEKAKKVYANEEAIEFFTRAIESYEKLESGKV